MKEETLNRVVELNDKLTRLKMTMEKVRDIVFRYTLIGDKIVLELNEYPYLLDLLRKHEDYIEEKISAEIAEIKQQISRL